MSETTDSSGELIPPLRTDLEVVEQTRSGKTRFVIKDLATNKIYGFPGLAMKVLQAIDGKSTLEDLARLAAGGREPTPAITENIASLVEQARDSGLLEGTEANAELASDTDAALGRSKKFNPFYIKLGVFDPSKWIDKFSLVYNLLFSRPMLVVLGLCLTAAAVLIARDFSRLWSTFEIFAYFKWWAVIYVMLILSTVLHELGHVMAIHRFGGKVREVGVILYLFHPGAYANVSDAWMFNKLHQRVAVALGGIYVEAFLWCASVATWLYTPPFTQKNQIAFVLMVVLLTRMLLNLIPFLRLDGYWVLTDVTGITNLRPKAFAYLLSKLPLVGSRFAPQRKPRTWVATVMVVYGLVSVTFVTFAMSTAAVGAYAFANFKLPEIGRWVFGGLALLIAPVLVLSASRYISSLAAVQQVGSRKSAESESDGVAPEA